MKHAIVILISFSLIVSCASDKPFLVVDPNSVVDEERLKVDTEQCIQIAEQYDLSGEMAGKAVAGAAIGVAAVAGVATAVAGAIFAPAIPFMIAGGAAGGGLWGSKISKEEREVRDKVLGDCMKDRGYKVYTSN